MVMRPHELQKMVSRRAVVFGGVQAAAGFALLSRLYILQFVHGDEFKLQAEGNSVKMQLLMPPRGIISDRYGTAMAMNQVNYRLVIEPDNRIQARASLKVLIDLMKLSDNEVKTLTEAIRVRKVGIPIQVREHLSWEEVARIQYHLPELAAATIEEGQWRHYPFADHSSHLIGYVGKVSEKQMDASQPLLMLPEMKIGQDGVESMYEQKLQGKAGAKQMEVNATGSPVRELSRKSPTAGNALPLTIDNRLQEFAISALAAESGAVVVMDVNTGEVLALVSMPAYDPNEFSKGIKSGYYSELLHNQRSPLMNKAIAGQYPPGSTFKMMTGLAGLKSGHFHAESRVFCNGTFMLGSKPFTCWKVGGHGSMNMAEAIQQSCDVYFYTVARETGIDDMAAMAHDFGLGQKSGLGLRGEQSGIVPSPAWKKKSGRAETQWNPGETINSAIGQGDTLTTPIQLAIMTSRLVNGGKKIVPRLLLNEPTKIIGQVSVSDEQLAIIRDGMYRVANEPHGTAYGSTIKDPEYAFGGKTGTSQVKKLAFHGQNQNSVPWELRHHAWFVGYAPVHKPEICVSVIIEHGGGGAAAAAPVARDVLRKALEFRRNPPLKPGRPT